MITNIVREFNLDPNIVGINTTDNLTTITTSGYFSTQSAAVTAINNGAWQWLPSDIVVIYYATNQIGWFTYDSATDSFVALTSGGLSPTLPNGQIFVGNASNVATAVAMSGDATLTNSGVITIANNAVTTAKIANGAITSTKLGAASVTSAAIANNAVQYVDISTDVIQLAEPSMTATDIMAMYAAPVLMIPAPGLGRIILIENVYIDFFWQSAQFTGGGPIALQYGNTALGAGQKASASLSAASFNALNSQSSIYLLGGQGLVTVAATATENQAVYISNTTAPFSTGNSSIVLYIKYRIGIV